MASAPAVSPSSSPRLPSPPPIAEDQTGPQSPPFSSEDNGRLGGPLPTEQSASRRIRPGTKAIDMAEGPPLIKLSDIDSAFQLTEHLKALHFHYTHPSNLDSTTAIDHATAALLSETPEGIDRALWLYELCRFLVQRVNSVIIALFADTPPCSAQTCQEMRASEWQYLCAVHDPPKSCCAIDYCCHTLDWAANTLTSPKHFPSRLTLGQHADGPSAQQQPVRQLTNIFRRVYRIFAHAWFSHRDMFWRIEGQTGLYILFKTVCDAYSLIPEDNYTIPPEAEGKEPAESSPPQRQAPAQAAQSILRRGGALEDGADAHAAAGDDTPPSAGGILPGATARRHKHNPSKGAPVATVMEENEEEEEYDAAGAPAEPSRRSSVIPRSEPVVLTLSPESSLEESAPAPLDPAAAGPDPSGPAAVSASPDATLDASAPPPPAEPAVAPEQPTSLRLPDLEILEQAEREKLAAAWETGPDAAAAAQERRAEDSPPPPPPPPVVKVEDAEDVPATHDVASAGEEGPPAPAATPETGEVAGQGAPGDAEADTDPVPAASETEAAD